MNKSKKFLIESGVLLTAMSIKAKKASKNIKEYFYEDETIRHISLVLYDLLPLSVKIGMRYEKFNEIFSRNFKGIRNALLGKETEINKEVLEEKQVVKRGTKTTVKKAPAVKKAKPKATTKKVQLDK